MTVAADVFPARDRAAISRWLVCLFVVLALHAGVALLLLSRRVAIEPPAAPPAAVMIDLAPLPAAVPAEPQPVREPEPVTPPPEPETKAPPEPQPVPMPEPEIVPPPPPIPVPPQAVTLPAPPPKPIPKPRPKPKTVEPRPPVVEPRPLPAVAPPPLPAAPAVASAPSANAMAARATWQAQLAAWLSRHKRYPRAAQEQRQQGRAYLRFSLDRNGRVLAFQLDRSSGFPLLDEEVGALIQRAQPLPPPPADVPGERFDLVVPVEFSLDRNQR